MQYVNTMTSVIVTAYTIEHVTLTPGGTYSIYLREPSMAIGLFADQTATYTPIPGDLYVDNGTIEASAIIDAISFGNTYLPVD